jgi:hypothetical protein
MRRSWRSVLVLAALAVAIGAAACGRPVEVAFEESGASLTLADVEALARTADLSPAEGIDVAHAPDARVDVLVWLRGRGSSGERAASLLTKGFPERTAAVPVLVRVAKVDGVRAVIVVEAIGETNGPLDARRLWVFEYSSGRLVSSSTYR